MRTFIAFTLPDEVANQIIEWQQQNMPEGVFPEPVTNLHMTLAFLGDTPDELVPKINQILSQLDISQVLISGPRSYTEQTKLAFLEFDEIGGSAVWEQINAQLNALMGYEPQFRPWLPHTTVWRFAPDHKPNINPPLPNLSFQPIAVTLYQSVRNEGGGATYQHVAGFEDPGADITEEDDPEHLAFVRQVMLDNGTPLSDWKPRKGNILDPIESELDQTVYQGEMPRKSVQDFIRRIYYRALDKELQVNGERWADLYMTGSLTTYQYSPTSDCDVSVFPDYDLLWKELNLDPDTARKRLIQLSIEHIDGTFLPGTTHPLQFFVVPNGTLPGDLYKSGLRSAFNLHDGQWFEKPEKDRVHDIAMEYPELFKRAQDIGDKLTQMLDASEEDAARQLWHQIHKKRQLDQQAGLGDFCEGNIVYKYLLNEGIFDRLRNELGEYIAKRSGWIPQIPDSVYQMAIYKHKCPMCGGYLEDRGGIFTCHSCPFEYDANAGEMAGYSKAAATINYVDTGLSEEHGDQPERIPWVYEPERDTLTIGEGGSTHRQLTKGLSGDDDETQWWYGVYVTPTNVAVIHSQHDQDHLYPEEIDQEVIDAIRQAWPGCTIRHYDQDGDQADYIMSSVKWSMPPANMAPQFLQQFKNTIPPQQQTDDDYLNGVSGYDWKVNPDALSKLRAMEQWGAPNLALMILLPSMENDWKRVYGLHKTRSGGRGANIWLHPFQSLAEANETLWHEIQHAYQELEGRANYENYNWERPLDATQYDEHPMEIDANDFARVMKGEPLIVPNALREEADWVPKELHLDRGDWNETDEQWQLPQHELALELEAQVNMFRRSHDEWAETWMTLDEYNDFYSKIADLWEDRVTQKVIYDFDNDTITLGTQATQAEHPDSKIIGEYKDGDVTLFGVEKQWISPQYFHRLWAFSYPDKELKDVYYKRDEGNIKLRTVRRPIRSGYGQEWNDPIREQFWMNQIDPNAIHRELYCPRCNEGPYANNNLLATHLEGVHQENADWLRNES